LSSDDDAVDLNQFHYVFYFSLYFFSEINRTIYKESKNVNKVIPIIKNTADAYLDSYYGRNKVSLIKKNEKEPIELSDDDEINPDTTNMLYYKLYFNFDSNLYHILYFMLFVETSLYLKNNFISKDFKNNVVLTSYIKYGDDILDNNKILLRPIILNQTSIEIKEKQLNEITDEIYKQFYLKDKILKIDGFKTEEKKKLYIKNCVEKFTDNVYKRL
jgi:hypothetical protein